MSWSPWPHGCRSSWSQRGGADPAGAARIEEEAAYRRASDERLRIARDLHDSLGRYLSMISVQSGVALNLNHDLPNQVRDSLVAVRQAGKEGLADR